MEFESQPEPPPRVSAWLHAQVLNASRRTRSEHVLVVGFCQGGLVVSDGKHSANCVTSTTAELGDLCRLDEIRVCRGPNGNYEYFATVAKVGAGTLPKKRPPDINADGSLVDLDAAPEAPPRDDEDLVVPDSAELVLESPKTDSLGLDVDMPSTATRLKDGQLVKKWIDELKRRPYVPPPPIPWRRVFPPLTKTKPLCYF